MTIHTKYPDGRFRMKCRIALGGEDRSADGGTGERAAEPPMDGRSRPEPCESKSFRADVAEQELDDLIALISPKDDALDRQVIEFKADPAIAAFRRALGELTLVGADDAGLRLKLAELEAADKVRKSTLSRPVTEFKLAAAGLHKWAEVWVGADTAKKNAVLRAAGIRVLVGRDEGVETGPVHVQAITSSNPVFQLALAAALSKHVRAFDGQEGCYPSNPHILVLFSPEFAAVAKAVFGDGIPANGMVISRPAGADIRRLGTLWLRRPTAGCQIWHPPLERGGGSQGRCEPLADARVVAQGRTCVVPRASRAILRSGARPRRVH